MIFDTHAHYNDSKFDNDRESLLKSLNENGIKYVTEVSASTDDFDKIIKLTSDYDFIYGALGVHPEAVLNLTDSDMELIKSLSSNNKIVAIGEIGLDYYWDENPDKEIQKKWFATQLEVAKECNLPVIIHSREACKDTLDVMTACNAKDIGGVIHCYSYSKEAAVDFLNMGFYFGIGGVVTYKNGTKLKEVVKSLPMDRILLETDCPYLPPTPFRGERNSSLYIPYIVNEIASLKGITADEVMEITMNNAKKMYKISE